MSFHQAVAACFAKYGTFSGRALRSEFWWFYLFAVLAGMAAGIVDAIVFGADLSEGSIVSGITNIALLVPWLAVSARRLHDTGKSGWWFLVAFTIIGIIFLMVWWAREGNADENRYGHPAADTKRASTMSERQNAQARSAPRKSGWTMASLILGMVGIIAVYLHMSTATSPENDRLSNLIALAKQGDANAQFELGWMYDEGDGVFLDDREAAKWYRLAAEQGHVDAQFNLGVMYDEGEGVSQDDGEAVRWYRLAAEQGRADAQFNLGVMYANGEGVPRDDRKAAKWYRLAAEQGVVIAQNNLGAMYANGEGVRRDDKEAVKWYRLAAARGHAVAQFNLGWMYDEGEGVLQDDGEAAKWYRLAAEQGVAEAQLGLGLMYDEGEGVRRDDQAAVKWYRLAAEQGLANAQYALGWMYANGEGVPRNYRESYIWFSLAVAGGFDATEERDDVERRLSPAARESAQQEANRRFNAISEQQARTDRSSSSHNPTGSALITQSGTRAGGGVLLFSGDISIGDADRLKRRIERGHISVIAFDSPGGSIAEALRIGRVIRSELIRTEVPYDAECHSACVIAFAGGVERVPHGPLGVHSFYSEDFLGSGDYSGASEIYEEAAMEIEAYLKDMRIPVALLDHMKRVSHEEIDILEAEKLTEYFLEGTDPVYRQTHQR